MNLNNHVGTPKWRATTRADLYVIQEIADEIHIDLPERLDVFAEKFTLFPEGCFVLMQNKRVVGYSFSHPWLLKDAPPLDAFLECLPASPECLFIHDVAVRQQARGYGAAGALIELIASLAEKQGIPCLALVSVYNTYTLWERFGFKLVNDDALTDNQKSYGDTARYMIRRLN